METITQLERWAVWAVAGAGVAVLACALPPIEAAGKNHCRTTADCLAGRTCVAGVCGEDVSDADGTGGAPPCPATACQLPMTCYRGLCAEAFVSEPPCDPYALDDGCPADAICFDDPDDVTRCRRFPACPTDGDCPVGPQGGVCNESDLPDKARMCLPNYCRDGSDCPVQWSCIRFFDAAPLGACGNGSNGMPCRANSDCDSDNCSDFLKICL